MNRFIKNNLMLLVVLAIALCITIFLIVLASLEYGTMLDNAKELSSLRAEVLKLQRQNKPNPSRENIPLLKKELDFFKNNSQKLKEDFSSPYDEAFNAFVKTIAPDKTPEEFKSEFKEDWEPISQGLQNKAARNIFLKEFQLKYSKNWDNAMAEFRQKLRDITVENIQENNALEILLYTIGVPRQMDGDLDVVNSFMNDFRIELIGLLKKADVHLAPEASSFSFEGLTGVNNDSATPTARGGRGARNNTPTTNSSTSNITFTQEEIPWVSRNWDIIGDIIKNISLSGVSSLDEFSKRSVIPETRGEFEVFNYTFKVVGTLEEIRNLVKTLDNSHSKKRTYIVRSINLYNNEENDKTKYLFNPELLTKEEEEKNKELKAEDNSFNTEMGPDGLPIPQERRIDRLVKKKKALEDESKKPFYERTGYGDIVSGGDKEFIAVINVDYINLTAN